MLASIVIGAMIAQERTVTFTHPCAHSSVVLEAFGKEIGDTIKIGGSVDKDFFLVRFDDMPVEDAKVAIAKTLDATWSTKDGVTYLGRTAAQENSDKLYRDKASREAIVKEMEAAKERMAKAGTMTLESAIQDLQKMKASNEPWYQFINKPDPGGRLADRLFLTFTVDELIDMPVGRWTYSPTPGPTEYQMPPSWNSAIDLYKKEMEVWHLAVKAEGESGYVLGGGGGGGDPITLFEMEIYREPDHIDFFYHRYFEGASGGGTVPVLYALPERPSQWGEFISGLNDPIVLEPEIKAKFEALGFDFSQTGQLLGGRPGYFNPPVKDAKERTALLDRIIKDVGKNDPLELLASWPFFAAAERYESNLVAVLSDRLVTMFEWVRTDSTSLGSFFEYMWFTDAHYDEKLNCWSIVQQFPDMTRSQRSDRSELSEYLRKVDSAGWSKLEDQSQNRTLHLRWLKLVDVAARTMVERSPYSSGSEGFAIRLYGSMPLVRRRAAIGGQIVVPIQDWPEATHEVFRTYDLSQGGYSKTGEWSKEDNVVASAKSGRLPSGTTLTMKVVQGNQLWLRSGEDASITTTSQSLATMIVFREKEADYNSGDDLNKLSYQPTEQLEVVLNVPGAGSVSMQADFRRSPKPKEFGPIEGLPPLVKKELLDAIKKARDGGR